MNVTHYIILSEGDNSELFPITWGKETSQIRDTLGATIVHPLGKYQTSLIFLYVVASLWMFGVGNCIVRLKQPDIIYQYLFQKYLVGFLEKKKKFCVTGLV